MARCGKNFPCKACNSAGCEECDYKGVTDCPDVISGGSSGNPTYAHTTSEVGDQCGECGESLPVGTDVLRYMPVTRKRMMTHPGCEEAPQGGARGARTLPAPADSFDVDGAARTVLDMIHADMADGLVPSPIRTFAELHEHVDANGYWLQTGTPWGADLPSVAGDPSGSRVVNAVTERVNALIADQPGGRLSL